MRKPEVLQTVVDYLVQHPRELTRAARNALGLKFGLPVAALRWLAARAGGSKVPEDLSIEAVPPGIRIGATVDVMGARLRASALVIVERLRLATEELRVELRITEVSLTLLNSSRSPLAALIQSGALDLSKVGNLIAVMPRRPEFLIEAKGERVVLDLARHPAFADERMQRALGLILPLVTVTGVTSDWEHVDLELGLFDGGVAPAVEAWKGFIGATLQRRLAARGERDESVAEPAERE